MWRHKYVIACNKLRAHTYKSFVYFFFDHKGNKSGVIPNCYAHDMRNNLITDKLRLQPTDAVQYGDMLNKALAF